MPPARTRRQLLTSAAAGATLLAGCSATGDPVTPGSVTPAPVPTDPQTRPPSTDQAPERPPLPPSDLAFDVAVISGFDDVSPARLAISVRNDAGMRLTALDGPVHVLPFVDDDYLGNGGPDDPQLLLVPQDARLLVNPDGQPTDRIEAYLPKAPVNGCWSVPFDWPADRVASTTAMRAVGLPPDGIRGHEYSLYFLEECRHGTVAFVNRFNLAAGNPPAEYGIYEARLGFELTVRKDGTVGVLVYEPVIETPEPVD